MGRTNLDELVVHTLDLLAWRLNRLEFLLNGGTALQPDATNTPDQPVLTRIKKLEQSLRKLAASNDAVSNLLKLYSKNPDILKRTPQSDLPELDHHQKLATVLSAATTLQTTASQLRSLADSELPPTSSFTTWAALRPRIEAAAARQEEQDRDISELQKRSAMLVTRWHEVQVLAQMRCWLEYEERVRRVERGVKRTERRRLESGG